MKAGRGNFSGKIGFVLAAAGSAIGLGNIWRFPYLAGANGGAAFLLIYLLCIALLCFPVMVGEIAIGRKSKLDAYGSYQAIGGKKWGYLGLFGIVVGSLLLSYYNVVAGWAFTYFIEITFGNLLNQSDYSTVFTAQINDITDNFWYSAGFIFVTALVVSQGIQHGIELANKILMPLLLLLLICLIIYGVTLPNAVEGIRRYLIPDLSEIKAQTIYDGLKQAFFSLSLGMGTLMTYGSYLKKDQSIVSSSASIIIADCSIAFLAGLMVFPLIASLSAYEVQGPSLIFVVMTNVFSNMGPIIGRIIGGGFFLLLCFAALTSTVSLLEMPVAYFVDQMKWNRKRAVWLCGLFIFIAGLPSMLSQGAVPYFNQLSFYGGQDFLTFISDMCDIGLTVGGASMCIFVIKKWKMANLQKELAHGHKSSAWLIQYVSFMITYVCPWLLGLLSLFIVVDHFFGVSLFF